MELTDLQIPLATRIQLTVAIPDHTPQTCVAQLLGYRVGQSMLLYLPKRPTAPLRSDLNVIARAGLQSAIIRFDTKIVQVHERPYLYLHLQYPDEVIIEQQLRQAPRFSFGASASGVVQESAAKVSCEFVDISLSGARLYFDEKLPTEAARLTLSCSVRIAQAEQQLELVAEIKSLPEKNIEAPFVYGVAFVEITPAQQILLQALCFELHAKKPPTTEAHS